MIPVPPSIAGHPRELPGSRQLAGKAAAEQGNIGDVCIIAYQNNNPRPYGCWEITDAHEFHMLGAIRWVLQLVTSRASQSAAEDAQKEQAAAAQAPQPGGSGNTGMMN